MDIDKVKSLVRDLHRELGLAEQPKKTKPVRVEYDPDPDGNGTWMTDYDENGDVVNRRLLPDRKVVHGLVSTEDVLPQQRGVEVE